MVRGPFVYDVVFAVTVVCLSIFVCRSETVYVPCEEGLLRIVPRGVVLLPSVCLYLCGGSSSMSPLVS